MRATWVQHAGSNVSLGVNAQDDAIRERRRVVRPDLDSDIKHAGLGGRKAVPLAGAARGCRKTKRIYGEPSLYDMPAQWRKKFAQPTPEA